MEENKCCGKDDACEKCKMGSCCGHKCCGYKCHGIFKILIPIILIVLAFYAGTLCGERNDFRGKMDGQRFMDKVFDTKGDTNSVTGSATVNVLPNTTTPTAE
jgi:hypothetical protein